MLDDGLDVLWLTAGLGCDGESIALTAATQPAVEDLRAGALPGVPPLRIHNPVFAYEVGDAFVDRFHRAARGEIDPFILVVEGSIPGRDEQAGRLLGDVRHRSSNGSADPDLGLDRSARAAARGRSLPSAPVPPTAASTRWRAIPPGCMGLIDYLGPQWKSKADVPLVCVPGCPTQPDNLTETLLYLTRQIAGRAPMIPLDSVLRPDVVVRADGARRLRSRRVLRTGRLRRTARLAALHRQAWLLGSGRSVQRRQAGVDGRHRRLRQRRWDLHRLHDARVSRQVPAVHGSATGLAAVV